MLFVLFLSSSLKHDTLYVICLLHTDQGSGSVTPSFTSIKGALSLVLCDWVLVFPLCILTCQGFWMFGKTNSEGLLYI